MGLRGENEAGKKRKLADGAGISKIFFPIFNKNLSRPPTETGNSTCIFYPIEV